MDSERQRVRVVRNVEEVRFLMRAGFQLGIYVSVIAEGGRTYTNGLGQTFTIEEGKSFIEIQPTSKCRQGLMRQSLIPLLDRARALREESS